MGSLDLSRQKLGCTLQNIFYPNGSNIILCFFVLEWFGSIPLFSLLLTDKYD